ANRSFSLLAGLGNAFAVDVVVVQDFLAFFIPFDHLAVDFAICVGNFLGGLSVFEKLLLTSFRQAIFEMHFAADRTVGKPHQKGAIFLVVNVFFLFLRLFTARKIAQPATVSLAGLVTDLAFASSLIVVLRPFAVPFAIHVIFHFCFLAI